MRPEAAGPVGPGSIECLRGVPVLVTGASGFIGRWVAQSLTRARAVVTLASRTPGAKDAADLFADPAAWDVAGRVVHLDLSVPGAAQRVVRECAPTVVFNLAGAGVSPDDRDPRVLSRVNDEAVGELIDALRGVPEAGQWRGPRLVHVGSAFEYGPIPGPVTEASDPAPNTEYGRSKLAGSRRVEAAAREGTLEAIVARLPTVFGAGEAAGRLLPSVLDALAAGRPLDLTAGRQERDWLWAGDAAEGLLRLACGRPPASGAVNVATGRLRSVRSFVEAAAEAAGATDPDLLRFGVRPTRDDEVHQGVLSIERLKAWTGWSPGTPLDEAIRHTAAFRAHSVERIGS